MTCWSAASTRRARDRPKDIIPPPPLAAIRRLTKKNTPISSSHGPKPTRISSNSDVPWFGFLALIVTPLARSS